MKHVIFVFLLSFVSSSFTVQEDFCIQPEERKLYDLLMTYRKQKGLPAIPLSYSLCKVAKLHVKDLAENNPTNSRCNMHSWSKSGPWTACCYTDDHKQAECMWNKPRELSDYTGDGFEIAAKVGEEISANVAMDGWKKSPGHNSVMINSSSWKKVQWQAVGVGIRDGYAVIWFGAEEDPNATELVECKN